jgi:nitrite reductase/ring-hydroxylating ferredoxin subunit
MGTENVGTGEAPEVPVEAPGTEEQEVASERERRGMRLSELLLAGVVVVIATLLLLALSFYVLPTSRLINPELQPAVRVSDVDNFPLGSSRVVTWGDRTILVIHSGRGHFALEGTSPFDGCILQWESESSRVVSPCTHVVYDLQGNVVVGLSRAPLRPYSVFERSGIVYVTE